MSMTAPFRHDTPFHPPVPMPRVSGHLDVGEGHRIWWEETGPEQGPPVLVLHGGPGGSVRPYYRRLLDPCIHRGIFFDQRGCGRSVAPPDMASNTTSHLIADIEALRRTRGIERWVVCGGSWGSTLALAYAEAFPERCAGLVVSGVFLARPVDIDWWWHGAAYVFPDVFSGRDAFLSEAERRNPRRAILARIRSGDETAAREAAAMLVYSETQTLDVLPPTVPDDPSEISAAIMTYAGIFAHYDAQDYFLEPGALIGGAARLRGIPGAIIAGRHDMCTPPGGAWDLHKAWDGSSLRIVANAGHRWNDEVLGLVFVPELARIVRLAFG